MISMNCFRRSSIIRPFSWLQTVRKMSVFCPKIRGLIAATLAPLDSKGELNLSIMDKYVKHLQQEQLEGIYVNGTTGESLLLTVDERKKLAEKWVEAGKDKLGNIIVQIGAANLKDTQELAKHSEDIGATSIAVLPTTFFTPKTLDDLVDYVSQVSNSAPNTPLFYYHIPVMTHLPFRMEDFLNTAKHKIPTLVGMKFTSSDMFDLGCCLCVDDGKFQMLHGREEILLSALAMGATASIGTTYSFTGKLHHRIIKAFNQGDMETAWREQYRSQALVKLFTKYGDRVCFSKTVIRMLGLDLGTVRSPLSKLDVSQELELRKDLERMGFFDWFR